MRMCRLFVAVSILLSAMLATNADDRSSIASSDIDGKPMPLLPGSFHDAPLARQPAVPVPEAPPDRAAPRSRLKNEVERERTVSELRALAARNARRSGRDSAGFTARLRRLGNRHGADALKQIEGN